MRSRQGLVLIIVAGILGVMTVLATCFVTMAQMERKASQRRVNGTQALLLARSGIEDALARLGAGQDPEAALERYRGEDWDADGILSSREASSQVYRPTAAGTAADRDDCPLVQAMRPSFPARTGTVPSLVMVDGRERGSSGRLSSAPAGSYSLKVLPLGGLYLNGGDPGTPTAAGASPVPPPTTTTSSSASWALWPRRSISRMARSTGLPSPRRTAGTWSTDGPLQGG